MQKREGVIKITILQNIWYLCCICGIEIEGFLKIDTLCFELSHSIESSLRSLSTMSRLLNDNSKLKSDDYTL